MTYLKKFLMAMLVCIPFASYAAINDDVSELNAHTFLVSYQTLFDTLSNETEAPDVHAFTPLAHEHGPSLEKLGATFIKGETPSLETVFQEIHACAVDVGVEISQISAVQSTILSQPAVDPETHLNTHEILSRVWHLATKLEPLDDGLSKAMVAISLAANVEEGGGCYGGIANRLLETYAKTLIICAENSWLLNS